MPDTGLLSPATVNPLMARKAAAQRSLLPVDSPFQQYNASYPQTWGQFGQNMAQAYPTPATGASRDQILGAVTQAAVNAGPLMTVYHGSPHKFDKFDASKIGTGEGAQAYGHGLYLAEAPEVARGYATNLANRDVSNQGRLNAHANAKRLADLAGDPKYAADDLKFALESDPQHPQKQLLLDTLQYLESGTYKTPLSNPGNLYKVDLPDDHIAKMLDWDKPLSQQPTILKTVNDFLASKEVGRYTGTSPLSGSFYYKHGPSAIPIGPGNDLQDAVSKLTGNKAYDLFKKLGNDSISSAYLKDAGIPGIRYLDGGSRAGGAGTSNFVVFPGNEGILKILDRK
jgi:hypothetical protein